MAPPKKSVKMDLGSFLADDSLGGSWADEEVDMSSIGVSISTAAPIRRDEHAFPQSSFRDEEPRRERKEFPIPDQPPYRARVGNLPWEVTEESLTRFFEDRMQLKDIISEIKLPVDTVSGRLKGFGFITFSDREVLEEALNLSMTEFNGRKIFVNVAAPQRQDVFEMDWRAARSGPIAGGSSRPKREEAELDWGAARTTSGLPPRERSGRGDRPPRKQEPEFDWSSARSTTATLAPRERSNRTERRPKKEEPELDWGAARTTSGLPPRERSGRGDRPPRKQEPEFDWSSARGSGSSLRQGSERKPRKQEPELDWKRGQTLGPRSKPSRASKKVEEEKKEQQPKLQKSLYDVLAVEDDSEDDGDKQEEENPEPQESGLDNAISQLSVDESKNDDDWEVVRK